MYNALADERNRCTCLRTQEGSSGEQLRHVAPCSDEACEGDSDADEVDGYFCNPVHARRSGQHSAGPSHQPSHRHSRPNGLRFQSGSGTDGSLDFLADADDAGHAASHEGAHAGEHANGNGYHQPHGGTLAAAHSSDDGDATWGHGFGRHAPRAGQEHRRSGERPPHRWRRSREAQRSCLAPQSSAAGLPVAECGGPLHWIGSRTRAIYYCAPERLEGQAATDRADVYSFGIVLYELMTQELLHAPGAGAPNVRARVVSRLHRLALTVCLWITLDSCALRWRCCLSR